MNQNSSLREVPRFVSWAMTGTMLNKAVILLSVDGRGMDAHVEVDPTGLTFSQLFVGPLFWRT